MGLPLVVLIVTFALLLVLNVPVAFSIGLATIAAVFAVGDLPAFLLVAQRMATGIDSFALLAIPFFILAGLLMSRGGIARQLMDCAEVFVGPFRGGLAYVNIVTCMLFGSISGSATAAVSSIGGFMVPEMERHGYDRDFSASVTITGATTGLLIPPSNIMIVYSLATGGAVSIAAIFIAGVLPGILVGLTLMVVAGIYSVGHGCGKGRRVAPYEGLVRCVKAVPSLLLVVIILGGILSGKFTATEASAVAVLYAALLAIVVYRKVKLRDLPEVLLQCGITTSVVFMLIGTSMAMSWILAHENIPQDVSAALLNLSDNKIVILLIMNLLLLAVGTFMDMTPAVLIFTPIFLPVAKNLGLDPIHFGIILIMNLCIGLCTPPVGTCLFLGCGIANTTMARVFRPLLPFFASMIVVLLVTTYLPWLALVLPRLFGLA
ncbi:MAG: TRAP transporter large permease [Planctomycetes bacterium]|nr:TRAP transporter large permease [Planctomycetota bacterium]